MPSTISCIVQNASRVRVADRAAALSYYMLLAVVPVLGITILLGGLIVEQTRVEQEIVRYAQATLGGQVATLFGDVIAHTTPENLMAVVLAGGFVFSYAVIRLFSILRTTLGEIFLLPKPRLVTFVDRVRYAAVAVGFGIALVGVMAVELMAAVGVRAMANQYFPEGGSMLEDMFSLAATFILAVVFFTAFYRIFSRGVVSMGRAVWAGTVTGVLYILGTTLFGVLFSASQTFEVYGITAPLMLFVVWLYYVMRTIMFGAILAGCSAPKIAELSEKITS